MSDGRQSPVVPLLSKGLSHFAVVADARSVYSSPFGVVASPESVPELMFTNPEELSPSTERTPVSPTSFLPQHGFRQSPLLADSQQAAHGEPVKRGQSMASGFQQSGPFEPDITSGAEEDTEHWPRGPQLPSLDPRRRVSNPLHQLPPITSFSSARPGDPQDRSRPPSIYISTPPTSWTEDPLYSPSQASASVSSSASHYGAGSYGSWEASPMSASIGHSYSDNPLDMRGAQVDDPSTSSPRLGYPLHTPTSTTSTVRPPFHDHPPSLAIAAHTGSSGSSPSQAGSSRAVASAVTAQKAAGSRSPRSPVEGASSSSAEIKSKSSASTSPTDLISIESLSADDNSTKGKRRGKLPRETTEYLKDWLMKHAAHPYPTEEEKKEMCRHTKLHMTQLSNWFINARRRILAPSRSLRSYSNPMPHPSGSSSSATASSSRSVHSATGYGHAQGYTTSQYSAFSESQYPHSRPHYTTHLSHPESGSFTEPQPTLPRSQSFAGVPTYGQQIYYGSQGVSATGEPSYAHMGPGVSSVLPDDPSPTTSPPGSAGSAQLSYPGGVVPQPHALRIPGDVSVPMLYSQQPHQQPRYYTREESEHYPNPHSK